MKVSGQLHAPAALLPRNLLDRKLDQPATDLSVAAKRKVLNIKADRIKRRIKTARVFHDAQKSVSCKIYNIQ
jgi:hypothetical protein